VQALFVKWLRNEGFGTSHSPNPQMLKACHATACGRKCDLNTEFLLVDLFFLSVEQERGHQDHGGWSGSGRCNLELSELLVCSFNLSYMLIYHRKTFLKTDCACRCVELKQYTVKLHFSVQAESTLETRQKYLSFSVIERLKILPFSICSSTVGLYKSVFLAPIALFSFCLTPSLWLWNTKQITSSIQ